jgi:beta-glucanase (GH16 family)
MTTLLPTFHRAFLRALVLIALCLAALPAPVQAQAQTWALVWSDEGDGFANTPPDAGKWAYDSPTAGSSNREWEVYCGQAGAGQTGACANWIQNAHYDGAGNLLIVATKVGNQWTSARLFTHGKKTYTYGKVEARIKLPVGPGLWPAFWQLGDSIMSGTPWPDCGELDVMENVPSLGPSTIRSSLHGPGYSGGNSLHADYMFPSPGRVDTAYHVYGAVWSVNQVQFYVDGTTFATFTPANMPAGSTWAFNNNPAMIILNLAVGGSWPKAPNRSTPNPAIMSVDYVRIYQ